MAPGRIILPFDAIQPDTPADRPRSVRWEPLAADGAARHGRLQTPHGPAPTPAFMPVGTVGSVKGVTVEQLHDSGSRIVLGNTYHLALRPGPELIAALGGLHRFMGWDGPMLTDSGGFQVFSLGPNVKLSEHGVEFRSHINGDKLELSPERAIEIQECLGADIIMQLDDVAALPSPAARLEEACERSIRWARRCQAAQTRRDQSLFGIVQGGLDPALRRRVGGRTRATRPGRLRHRRPQRRRVGGGDVRRAGHCLSLAARRSAPLPDGRGHSR